MHHTLLARAIQGRTINPALHRQLLSEQLDAVRALITPDAHAPPLPPPGFTWTPTAGAHNIFVGVGFPGDGRLVPYAYWLEATEEGEGEHAVLALNARCTDFSPTNIDPDSVRVVRNIGLAMIAGEFALTHVEVLVDLARHAGVTAENLSGCSIDVLNSAMDAADTAGPPAESIFTREQFTTAIADLRDCVSGVGAPPDHLLPSSPSLTQFGGSLAKLALLVVSQCPAEVPAGPPPLEADDEAASAAVTMTATTAARQLVLIEANIDAAKTKREHNLAKDAVKPWPKRVLALVCVGGGDAPIVVQGLNGSLPRNLLALNEEVVSRANSVSADPMSCHSSDLSTPYPVGFQISGKLLTLYLKGYNVMGNVSEIITLSHFLSSSTRASLNADPDKIDLSPLAVSAPSVTTVHQLETTLSRLTGFLLFLLPTGNELVRWLSQMRRKCFVAVRRRASTDLILRVERAGLATTAATIADQVVSMYLARLLLHLRDDVIDEAVVAGSVIAPFLSDSGQGAWDVFTLLGSTRTDAQVLIADLFILYGGSDSQSTSSGTVTAPPSGNTGVTAVSTGSSNAVPAGSPSFPSRVKSSVDPAGKAGSFARAMAEWKITHPSHNASQSPCFKLLLFGHCGGCHRNHQVALPSRKVLGIAAGGLENLTDQGSGI